MKKLLLIDHNGAVVFEQDVFLEGQDTVVEWGNPTAFWLGKIALCNPENLEGLKQLGITPKAEEEIVSLEASREEEQELDKIVDNEPGEVLKEEALNEPEAISDKGIGNQGISEAEQSPGIKEAPKKGGRRKAAHGDKGLRDSKAA